MNKKMILFFFIALAIAVIILAVKVVYTPQPKPSQPVVVKSEKKVNTESEKGFLTAAEDAEKRQDLLGAKEAYQKFVEKFPASDKMQRAQGALENINIALINSPIITSDSVVYEVKKGNNLVGIAKKFDTTPELIMKSNDLKNTIIRIGQKLKVSKAKFSIVVDKSLNIMTLKSGPEIVKTYRVSTGKNSCTPVGTFTINSKIVNPSWYPPTGGVIQSGDPKNVLGSRWLGLTKPSYGIHGTTEPDSIGQSVTEGCVRLKNSEAEELYDIVPYGTEVIIVD